MKKKYFFWILFIVGWICANGYFWVKVQIRAVSWVSGYQLQVGPSKLIRFLVKNGYYGGEGLLKTATIAITSIRQPYMLVTKAIGQEPFQSALVNKDIRGLAVTAQYSNAVLEEMLSYGENGQKRLNTDLLVDICVAQQPVKTGLFTKDSCYQLVSTYLNNNKDGWIFRLQRAKKTMGFHFVEQVLGCNESFLDT